jgi:hypothetical protein
VSAERTVFVRLPDEIKDRILGLSQRAASALRRSEKLSPGDRTEVTRLRAIQAVVDQMAVMSMFAGAPSVVWSGQLEGRERPTSLLQSDGTGAAAGAPEQVRMWLAEGHAVAMLLLPHFAGETILGGLPGVGPQAAAERWKASSSDGRGATQERFEFLLYRALEDPADARSALRPSDVSNTVLTETLRRHACWSDPDKQVALRVVYRDGSEGPPFPMRCVQMLDTIPEGWRVLRFALMSIRHVEMDAAVDGAWLRNSKVSRPRPAGLTDAMVFETSLRQLRHLGDGPTELHMFQTGLEPAVVGFYRAVIHRMLEKPRALAVVPQYFQGEGAFSRGTVWRST